MTKTVFVVYRDEILDRSTKLKRSLKIGEYDNPELARAVWKTAFEDRPGDNVEIRIEQEERIVKDDVSEPSLETRISLVEKYLFHLSTLVTNQITLIDSFSERVRKLEKRLYNN